MVKLEGVLETLWALTIVDKNVRPWRKNKYTPFITATRVGLSILRRNSATTLFKIAENIRQRPVKNSNAIYSLLFKRNWGKSLLSPQ